MCCKTIAFTAHAAPPLLSGHMQYSFFRDLQELGKPAWRVNDREHYHLHSQGRWSKQLTTEAPHHDPSRKDTANLQCSERRLWSWVYLICERDLQPDTIGTKGHMKRYPSLQLTTLSSFSCSRSLANSLSC